MKVSTHPLMVAVALGLLGPGALAAPEAESDAQEARSERGEGIDLSDLDQVASALDSEAGPEWTRLELVDEADEAKSWS